jgi:hypothetical protein
VGRIGVNVLTPLTDPRMHARTKERNKTNSFSEALWREKKNLKLYKFSNALQVRLFYLWQKGIMRQRATVEHHHCPARSLTRGQDFFSSTHARTYARKEPWLPSQIAVQRSTKPGWAREKVLLHRSHSSSDPTVITPFSFHINGHDWKHMHIF